MAIIRYRPHSLLSELSQEMNRMFADDYPGYADGSKVETSQWQPAVDIKEEEKQFVITADIPGVDPKDIKLHMEANVLTIEGERLDEHTDESAGYRRVERARGIFYRRFSLPDTADEEGISAKGKHGVLEITIPKKDKSNGQRRIAIDVE
jgi:HSP20 family protein